MLRELVACGAEEVREAGLLRKAAGGGGRSPARVRGWACARGAGVGAGAGAFVRVRGCRCGDRCRWVCVGVGFGCNTVRGRRRRCGVARADFSQTLGGAGGRHGLLRQQHRRRGAAVPATPCPACLPSPGARARASESARTVPLSLRPCPGLRPFPCRRPRRCPCLHLCLISCPSVRRSEFRAACPSAGTRETRRAACTTMAFQVSDGG